MHESTKAILEFFDYGRLPAELQEVSEPIGDLARRMAAELTGPELTAGLRKLLEAKDCLVRAKVAMSKK